MKKFIFALLVSMVVTTVGVHALARNKERPVTVTEKSTFVTDAVQVSPIKYTTIENIESYSVFRASASDSYQAEKVVLSKDFFASYLRLNIDWIRFPLQQYRQKNSELVYRVRNVLRSPPLHTNLC